VKIIGSRTPHFCTAYVGLVFSISGHDGRYPPLSVLPLGGIPLHVGCTKTLVAFVPELARPADLAAAELSPSDAAVLDARLSAAARLIAARSRAGRIAARA
jgi:hypothetical protein